MDHLNIGHRGHIHNVIPESATWMGFRPVQIPTCLCQNTIETYVNGHCSQVRVAIRTPNITTEIVGEVVGLGDDQNRPVTSCWNWVRTRRCRSLWQEAGLQAWMSVVVCGPGSIDQAHKPDEFIELSQLDACLSFLTQLEGKLVA